METFENELIQSFIVRHHYYDPRSPEQRERRRTRANGEGSIRKLHNGRFEGRYTAGFKDGKPIRKSVYAATRKDCNTQMQKCLKDIKLSASSIITEEVPTLSTWLNIWLNDYRKDLGVASRKRYLAFITKLDELATAKKKLNELLPIELQQYINTFQSYELSKRAIGMFSASLQCAMDNGFLTRNPAAALRIPINTPQARFENSKKAFTIKEEKAFLEDIHNNLYKTFYQICLYAGLRRGEVASLSWNNINLDKREIHVLEAATRGQEKGYTIGKTKNATSVRVVPISDTLYQILNNIIHTSKFVCPNAKNEMVNSDVITTDFGNIMKRLKFKHTLHHLRHTFATRCMEKGINIKVVQMWMGHSNSDMTLNTYTHATDDLITQELAKLNQ